MLKIRLATIDDMELVYQWANNPLTRQSSFNSQSIKFPVHKKWFISKLESDNSFVYIIENNVQAIAVVRFERNEETVIGITVAPEARGKGLAVQCLISACNTYKKQHNDVIFAYIKLDNIASIKSFEKAGFKYNKETVVNNHHCYLLKY